MRVVTEQRTSAATPVGACICSPDCQKECCPLHGRYKTLTEAFEGGREHERAMSDESDLRALCDELEKRAEKAEADLDKLGEGWARRGREIFSLKARLEKAEAEVAMFERCITEGTAADNKRPAIEDAARHFVESLDAKIDSVVLLGPGAWAALRDLRRAIDAAPCASAPKYDGGEHPSAEAVASHAAFMTGARAAEVEADQELVSRMVRENMPKATTKTKLEPRTSEASPYVPKPGDIVRERMTGTVRGPSPSYGIASDAFYDVEWTEPDGRKWWNSRPADALTLVTEQRRERVPTCEADESRSAQPHGPGADSPHLDQDQRDMMRAREWMLKNEPLDEGIVGHLIRDVRAETLRAFVHTTTNHDGDDEDGEGLQRRGREVFADDDSASPEGRGHVRDGVPRGSQSRGKEVGDGHLERSEGGDREVQEVAGRSGPQADDVTSPGAASLRGAAPTPKEEK